MEYGTILVKLTMSYFLINVVRLIFSSSHRKRVVKQNNKLDELRQKPIKTLEEQKKFINEKFGKIRPWSFGLEFWWNFFWNMFIFGISFFIISYIFDSLNISINLLWGIIISMLFPIVLNFILLKFKLQQKNNLFDILR